MCLDRTLTIIAASEKDIADLNKWKSQQTAANR